MKLIYRPDGQEPQEWEFVLGKFRVGEMKTVEKATGMPFATEFKDRLFKGDSTARQALLWVLRRRTDPTLQLRDVDFADDELTLEFSLPEWQDMRQSVEEAPGLSDDQRTVALAAIDSEIAQIHAEQQRLAALIPDEGQPVDEGKAPSKNSATATG